MITGAAVAAAGLVAIASLWLTAGVPVAVAVDTSAAQKYDYDRAFQQARDQASSDFERSVLADGLITKAEYQQSFDRFIGCVTAQGYEASASWAGAFLQYSVAMPLGDPEVEDTSKFDATTDACSTGTTRYIESLYNNSNGRPCARGVPDSYGPVPGGIRARPRHILRQRCPS